MRLTTLALSFALCTAPAPCQQEPAPSAAALCEQADLLAEQGSHVRAVARYTEALAADAHHLPSLIGRGRVHLDLGRFTEAERDFGRAVARDPDNASVVTLQGYAQLESGDQRKALATLQRAFELEPDSAVTLDMLATAELRLGMLPKALEHVEAAIAIDDEDPEYHFTHSQVLRALGRSAEANAAAQRAERLDPDYRNRQVAELDVATVVQALLGLMLFAALGLGVLSLIGLSLAGSTRRAMAAVPEGHTPARYDGSAAELFKVYLQNVVLTVLTLGVYRFWARVRMMRYRYQHTAFGGARFDYHATGREKLVGFLKGMLVLAPLVAGLWLLHDALLPHYGDETAFSICIWSFALLLFLLRPLILVGSQRFNLSRTSWCNLRFRFTGRVGAAYRMYLTDLVLMVLTLGIYGTWHQCNVRRFKLKNTRLGDLEFNYRGDGGQLFGITFGGGLLCYVTAGIYSPWLIARLHRYHLEHTYVRGRHLRSRLTGGHVLSVGAPALLVSIVTLGLALPWALDRWYRLLTDTTSFPQPIDVDRLRAMPDTQASPVLEGVGEAGEALSGLGDLFGG